MLNRHFTSYHLVMTNSSPWYRWPIEIDGLPFLKMVDLSMAMLVITRGYMFYRFLLAAHKPLGNTRNERHLKICTMFSLFTFARVHTKKKHPDMG